MNLLSSFGEGLSLFIKRFDLRFLFLLLLMLCRSVPWLQLRKQPSWAQLWIPRARRFQALLS